MSNIRDHFMFVSYLKGELGNFDISEIMGEGKAVRKLRSRQSGDRMYERGRSLEDSQLAETHPKAITGSIPSPVYSGDLSAPLPNSFISHNHKIRGNDSDLTILKSNDRTHVMGNHSGSSTHGITYHPDHGFKMSNDFGELLRTTSGIHDKSLNKNAELAMTNAYKESKTKGLTGQAARDHVLDALHQTIHSMGQEKAASIFAHPEKQKLMEELSSLHPTIGKQALVDDKTIKNADHLSRRLNENKHNFFSKVGSLDHDMLGSMTRREKERAKILIDGIKHEQNIRTSDKSSDTQRMESEGKIIRYFSDLHGLLGRSKSNISPVYRSKHGVTVISPDSGHGIHIGNPLDQSNFAEGNQGVAPVFTGHRLVDYGEDGGKLRLRGLPTQNARIMAQPQRISSTGASVDTGLDRDIDLVADPQRDIKDTLRDNAVKFDKDGKIKFSQKMYRKLYQALSSHFDDSSSHYKDSDLRENFKDLSGRRIRPEDHEKIHGIIKQIEAREAAGQKTDVGSKLSGVIRHASGDWKNLSDKKHLDRTKEKIAGLHKEMDSYADPKDKKYIKDEIERSVKTRGINKQIGELSDFVDYHSSSEKGKSGIAERLNQRAVDALTSTLPIHAHNEVQSEVIPNYKIITRGHADALKQALKESVAAKESASGKDPFHSRKEKAYRDSIDSFLDAGKSVDPESMEHALTHNKKLRELSAEYSKVKALIPENHAEWEASLNKVLASSSPENAMINASNKFNMSIPAIKNRMNAIKIMKDFDAAHREGFNAKGSNPELSHSLLEFMNGLGHLRMSKEEIEKSPAMRVLAQHGLGAHAEKVKNTFFDYASSRAKMNKQKMETDAKERQLNIGSKGKYKDIHDLFSQFGTDHELYRGFNQVLNDKHDTPGHFSSELNKLIHEHNTVNVGKNKINPDEAKQVISSTMRRLEESNPAVRARARIHKGVADNMYGHVLRAVGQISSMSQSHPDVHHAFVNGLSSYLNQMSRGLHEGDPHSAEMAKQLGVHQKEIHEFIDAVHSGHNLTLDSKIQSAFNRVRGKFGDSALLAISPLVLNYTMGMSSADKLRQKGIKFSNRTAQRVYSVPDTVPTPHASDFMLHAMAEADSKKRLDPKIEREMKEIGGDKAYHQTALMAGAVRSISDRVNRMHKLMNGGQPVFSPTGEKLPKDMAESHLKDAIIHSILEENTFRQTKLGSSINGLGNSKNVNMENPDEMNASKGNLRSFMEHLGAYDGYGTVHSKIADSTLKKINQLTGQNHTDHIDAVDSITRGDHLGQVLDHIQALGKQHNVKDADFSPDERQRMIESKKGSLSPEDEMNMIMNYYNEGNNSSFDSGSYGAALEGSIGPRKGRGVSKRAIGWDGIKKLLSTVSAKQKSTKFLNKLGLSQEEIAGFEKLYSTLSTARGKVGGQSDLIPSSIAVAGKPVAVSKQDNEHIGNLVHSLKMLGSHSTGKTENASLHSGEMRAYKKDQVRHSLGKAITSAENSIIGTAAPEIVAKLKELHEELNTGEVGDRYRDIAGRAAKLLTEPVEFTDSKGKTVKTTIQQITEPAIQHTPTGVTGKMDIFKTPPRDGSERKMRKDLVEKIATEAVPHKLLGHEFRGIESLLHVLADSMRGSSHIVGEDHEEPDVIKKQTKEKNGNQTIADAMIGDGDKPMLNIPR